MTTIYRQRARSWTTPVARYFILAILVSWACWIPVALVGRTVERGDVSPSHVPGLLGPMVAALITTWLVSRKSGVHELVRRMASWRVGWRWWLVAFSPLAFFVIAAPIARLIDGSWPEWSAFDRMNGFPEIGVVPVWALVVLLNGFGEETGWRGFATDRLQRSMTPLAATLIVTVVWAVWHAPLFFFVSGFENFRPGTLVGFFFGMACGAVVLTWVYNGTGRSILIVAVWHGTYNIVSGSAGAEGTIQAVVTTCVMAQAIWLVSREVRTMRHGGRSVLDRR
jgi:membrane protease YdiL (CAAX protease family)